MRLAWIGGFTAAVAATACGADTTTVRVTTGGSLLVAAHVDGAWTRLASRAETALDVGETYAVTTVCGGADWQWVETWLLAPDDGDPFVAPCADPPDVTAPVTVTALGGAPYVYIGDAALTAPGTVELPIGQHDLVAIEGTRYLLRRGVEVHGPQEVVLDMAQAQPLEPRAVTGVDAPFELLVRLDLDRVHALLPADAATAYVLPSTAVRPYESQTVTIETPTVWETLPVVDGDLAAALPPPLDDVTFDETPPRARWSTAGDYDRARLAFVESGATAKIWMTVAHPAWTAASGAGALDGLDITTMPGWDPSWTMDPSTPRQIVLAAWRTDDDDHTRGARVRVER